MAGLRAIRARTVRAAARGRGVRRVDRDRRRRPFDADQRRSSWRLRAASILAGAAVAGALGTRYGVGVGAAVAAGLWWASRRWSGGPDGDLTAAAADLPIAVDLLAAAVRAGAPPARAAEVVGAALAGPLGRQLARVGTALRLGTTPAQAWAPLSRIPDAGRLCRAAVRSADSGAAMTGAFGRLADDLRTARAARAEAGAQRLGVLVVLPLGLCFLPAFVLTGVVPVVVAVLGGVLSPK
ncbi:MAG: hypothetical protein QOI74_1442 [Micromonosporaceae bacterium]|jgi:Flp pilus assembly protein TadB|nr:hypothetical protein [Micromonosporaceae bacterium]